MFSPGSLTAASHVRGIEARAMSPKPVSPLKSVSPEMGTTYVVDAFMVVVLGGTQSLMGTLASSGILGELPLAA